MTTSADSDLRETLRTAMIALQEDWRTEDADTRELWWAMLDLESVTVEDSIATFVLHDRVDDSRHGWRWRVIDSPSLPISSWMFVSLAEDLNESEPTDPDEHAIRWWGVHLFPNGRDEAAR